DRPAMVAPPPRSSFSRYSLKSRSTTALSESAAATFVSWPQYGHFRERVRGSNSTLAPHCSHGKSFPAAVAFRAGGIGGGASDMGRRGQRTGDRGQKAAHAKSQ